jgi:hypothetical protein
MQQEILNWIIGGMGTLIMFFIISIWQEVKTLQTADRNLVDRLSAIEILVAGDYVRKDDLQIILHKLDKIEDKLDKKADK